MAIASAVLLIISFPDFDLWPFAWVGLVPVLVLVARKPQPWRCFFWGWLFGTIFFFGSAYWLTYSLIHFGGIPSPFAFMLLLPATIVVGVFPAFAMMALARVVGKLGAAALFLAPLLWPALEWARLGITGQLWNALGYSQAYHPLLIQSARWGGVYAISCLIVLVNSALAFTALKRTKRAFVISAGVVLLVAIALLTPALSTKFSAAESSNAADGEAIVVAIQPNVPMDLLKSDDQVKELTARHFEMSEAALHQLPDNGPVRLVIWPESPMNYTYGTDSSLRERLAAFARAHHTSILLNSQEVAPNDGIYNSALLINEQGSLVAQYDKIRLLPFGEYVPLPRWLPGVGLITAIVGDFAPGANYRLMPVGKIRSGVFICIESAYPSIARRFTNEGADVLINISNDGYLGPTAVRRQHLANAVFRAVENGRPLVRVTNTGITAFITSKGEVKDATQNFKPDVRTWGIARAFSAPTFYARHGDLFAAGCALLSGLVLLLSFIRSREKTSDVAT